MTDDLGPRPAPGQEMRGSRLTEAFFDPEGRPPGTPLLIFQHIQKTAGSALRRLIRRNLRGCEVHQGQVAGLRDRTRDELLGWYGDWYRELQPAQRDGLRCVMSHSANYLVPAAHGPALTIAIVRDPVDRVLSQYYFAKSNRGKAVEPTGQALPTYYKQDHPATLGDVYRELEGARPGDSVVATRYSRFFNGQARSLLGPHFDVSDLAYTPGPPPDADRWREQLFAAADEHYLLGVQERVAAFADEVTSRMGWPRAELARAKVNAARPALAELSGEMGERMRAFNWLDDELHRRAAVRDPGAAVA
jgi:hypothetical protein